MPLRAEAPAVRSSAPEARALAGLSSWNRASSAIAPLVVAVLAAAYVLVRGVSDPEVSDFDQIWHAARALMQGANPYEYVGPTGTFRWDYLYYPLPAVLVVSPLAFLPLLAARALFAALTAGLLAAAVVRDMPVRLLIFLSAPTMIAVGRGQWAV